MQAAASGFDRSQPWRRWGLWLLVLLSAELCLALTGTQVSKLFDRDGLGNAGAILAACCIRICRRSSWAACWCCPSRAC